MGLETGIGIPRLRVLPQVQLPGLVFSMTHPLMVLSWERLIQVPIQVITTETIAWAMSTLVSVGILRSLIARQISTAKICPL